MECFFGSLAVFRICTELRCLSVACVSLISATAAQGIPASRVKCHADVHFLRQRRQTGEQREQADFHCESLAFISDQLELMLDVAQLWSQISVQRLQPKTDRGVC